MLWNFSERPPRSLAPPAPAPAGGLWEPRAARHAAGSVPSESRGTELLWEPPSPVSRGREPRHQRQAEEIPRSARPAAPLTWSWENAQQAPFAGGRGGVPRRPEGSFPWKDGGGTAEGDTRAPWALAPPWPVSPEFGAPHHQPVSMESVVSCCDNSRSCHEGLAKHLTLSLRAQLSGRQTGGGDMQTGNPTPTTEDEVEGRPSYVKMDHPILLSLCRFYPQYQTSQPRSSVNI